MERIGIIDLGSNSVRLVIVEVDDNRAYYQRENLKETVRLISDIDEHGLLSEKAMHYAIETIQLFLRLCKTRRVDHLITVATAAARQAGNRRLFIERIRQETGLDFKVLSGEEEAYYGYLGTVNTMPQTSGLMADLGGGSLKLVSFVDRMMENSHHLPFGSVTLTNSYKTMDRPDPRDLQQLEKDLADTYRSLPWIQGDHPIIGVGGTFRSLARVVRKSQDYIPDITDAFELDYDDVKACYERLSQMSLEERLTVPGLERARADIIVAGTAAIKCLMEASGRRKIITSTTSIRDGLLYEHLHRYTKDPIVLSVITHHIDNLILYYRLEENHLRRVSNLAVTLFDQIYELHGLNGFERRLLLIASLLHEIGSVIDVEGRDKHTLYMLLNAPVHGLTHRERVITAYVAASHDDLYLANIDQYAEHGPLLSDDIDLIKKLAILLQIAHALDRGQTGIVTRINAEVLEDKCLITIRAKSHAELEINDARRRENAFAKFFGRSLSIVPGDSLY
ncbi:MAG: Ppx/GppA family phosphatase [Firmicutes bacterium]|nr:Ppx/GppA family phosphatase [Bacillota bacterium]